MLLEQTLVGPSPNLQLLSYLRHAVATQVGPTTTCTTDYYSIIVIEVLLSQSVIYLIKLYRSSFVKCNPMIIV